jgi:hypothetical protein
MQVINYLKRVNGSEHIVEHVGWHESGDYLLRLLFSETENPFRQHKYEVEKEYTVIDKAEVDKLERQSCGRRMNELGPFERKENLDHWAVLANGDKVCSFCGSLHPMTVIDIIKKYGFGSISRTDKSYKWYVKRPEVHNAMDGGIKYYRHHDTPEFIAQYNDLITQSTGNVQN